MDRTLRRLAVPVAAGIALATAFPAFAASDYLLQIEDYAGPGKPETIELESWSFGASSPALTGGSVSVRTAREASSGLATGRRSCATGRHFPAATLSSATERWVLRDVTVSGCPSGGMSFSYGTAQRVTKTRSNIQNN